MTGHRLLAKMLVLFKGNLSDQPGIGPSCLRAVSRGHERAYVIATSRDVPGPGASRSVGVDVRGSVRLVNGNTHRRRSSPGSLDADDVKP